MSLYCIPGMDIIAKGYIEKVIYKLKAGLLSQVKRELVLSINEGCVDVFCR